MSEIYNLRCKIWGALPEKKSGGQKRAKFGVISDNLRLRILYLRNGWRCLNSEN